MGAARTLIPMRRANADSGLSLLDYLLFVELCQITFVTGYNNFLLFLSALLAKRAKEKVVWGSPKGTIYRASPLHKALIQPF